MCWEVSNHSENKRLDRVLAACISVVVCFLPHIMVF